MAAGMFYFLLARTTRITSTYYICTLSRRYTSKPVKWHCCFFVLQMEKSRLKEGKPLCQCFRAAKWQSWDWKPNRVASEACGAENHYGLLPCQPLATHTYEESQIQVVLQSRKVWCLLQAWISKVLFWQKFKIAWLKISQTFLPHPSSP